ncbi:MAG: CotH kinase family protein, partial [Syntrophothermus sp.]
YICLTEPSGNLIDSVSFGPQQTDISLGRFPNGSADWVRFSPATPGSSNIESGVYNFLSAPVFSVKGGFYDAPVTLSLTASDPAASIRYTTDGSIPLPASPVYISPLKIDSTTVISARTFRNGYTASTTVVSTYFINFHTELPVFSLATNPENFFSDTIGIYVAGTRGITGNCSTAPRNWNQDWERPVNLEFFEKNKNPEFNVKTGAKIYGGCTRLYDEKSLAFYFDDTYGMNKLKYRLFDDIPVTEYKNFCLKNSGQDWYRSMFRDPLVQTLVKQGMNVDYSEYRPALLFINGKYWGIHNIYEKMNETYINYRYGINPDSIDLLENSPEGKPHNGDNIAYQNLLSFLNTHSLADSASYSYIKSVIDVDEYTDYNIVEIYSANGDWPANNTKFWRERSPKGKWRWLLFDTDFGFGGNAQGLYTTNTLEQATAVNSSASVSRPWATFILRKMLESPEFKNEFIQRMAVHMSTTFFPDHVLQVIDSLKNKISSEIPRHKSRWAKTISMGTVWLDNVKVVQDFAVKRQSEVRSHFYTKFGLAGACSVKVSRNNPGWGKVYAHTVEVRENGLGIILFKNIPFKVKAVPMPGYRFVRWEGESASEKDEIQIIPSVNTSLTAIFELDSSKTSSVVINEINYKSSPSFDTNDWIELFNPAAAPIDVSGWKIYNEKLTDAFSFSAGTVIPGYGYLVVCRDSALFNKLHLNRFTTAGNTKFKLDSQGDIIKVIDSSGSIIDTVRFKNSGDWPVLPDALGLTLSLINPKLDNSKAVNWKPSGLYGTPGRLNDTYITEVKSDDNSAPGRFYLYANYPNPFNNSTVVSFSIPEASFVRLRIFDILGREVAVLKEGQMDSGTYNYRFNAELGSGIYICVLQAGKYTQSRKMLLLK